MADKKQADFEGVLNPKRVVDRREAAASEPEDRAKGKDAGDLPGPGFNFFKGKQMPKREAELAELLKKRK